MDKDVLAIILAGGAGGRLQPLTQYRAKPSVPFGGQYRRLEVSYKVLERPMRLDGLHVRFADAEGASQWSSAHADQVAAYMVETSGVNSSVDALAGLTPPSPWYLEGEIIRLETLIELKSIDSSFSSCCVLLNSDNNNSLSSNSSRQSLSQQYRPPS